MSKRGMATLETERALWSSGVRHIAGLDEAGRGPLAGPVVAAAVIFHPERIVEGVDDSKKLRAAERELLFDLITARAIAIGVGVIDHATIDEINILQATLRAMAAAVEQLPIRPDHLLIDGPRYQESDIPYTARVDGDARSVSIAAASIIAKVTRDRLMAEYDRRYPVYGFGRHKGYGTAEHLAALREHGPCAIHRRSFRMPGKDHA